MRKIPLLLTIPLLAALFPQMPANSASVVSDWVDLALSAVANSPSLGDPITSPTTASRAYGILGTVMYDAWSAYEPTPISTRLGDSWQRPLEENTQSHKTEAISYGAYRVLSELFPAQEYLFRGKMLDLGFDPDYSSSDITTAAGIGNVMAETLMEFRRLDGSNQGNNYADTTGYAPVNTTAPNQAPTINDITRWTPEHIPIDDFSAPIETAATPHWGGVIPFALTSGSQFRPPSPEPFLLDPLATADLAAGTITRRDGEVVSISRELIGVDINPNFIAQSEEIVSFSANLTDEQKLIAEYWEDPKGTYFPPGHWLAIAQFVSERDGYTLDEDVQLFFLLSNALMDAGIAAWEVKYFYDYTRPVRAIRELGRLCLLGTEDVPGSGQCYIDAWAGPGLGTQLILAEDFLTYQTPGGNPSPPFPEYVSGHSTYSAAAAEILRRFTGSDLYGESITFSPGSSRFEPGFTPEGTVTLSWVTFSEAADQAGLSRRYGGIHFTMGDEEGRRLGYLVADQVWASSQLLLNGRESQSVPEPRESLALLGLGSILLLRCRRG